MQSTYLFLYTIAAKVAYEYIPFGTSTPVSQFAFKVFESELLDRL